MKKIVTLKQSLLMNSSSISKLGDTIDTKHGPLTFIDNGADVLAVCHRDTVKWNRKPHIGKRWIKNCPPKIGCPKFDVLITDSEEIGCSTAQFFNAPKDYRYMFEIDRNGSDAVFYDYHNPLFECFISEQWDIGRGSFTDICYLDHLGIAGVNFGTGYFNAHFDDCYADLKITRDVCNRWATMMTRLEGVTFDNQPKHHIEKEWDLDWKDYDDGKSDQWFTNCQSCGEWTEDDWNYCPFCGDGLYSKFVGDQMVY
jgi:hypothetical protein